ncbi:hypothetical protein [Actinoplanes sp. NBRC 103695]|uniref:hypothetical protein n=1 Tax=Actinoplanes sp. NBRC 103695 TaxID=3032202 RepID=UPI0024A1447F|nr:hypothetical protein [Actinoplanes sp. NBRC 103695]GLZ01614.1 hypothetical protein Acsp02_88650 [Actinoplanes sp. NBRC 103695]
MTLYTTARDRSLHALWGDEQNAVVAKLPATATKKQQEALAAALTGLSVELRRSFGADTLLPYGGASPISRRARRKHSIEVISATGEGRGFVQGMVPRPPQYDALGRHAEEIRRVLTEVGDTTLMGEVGVEVQREIAALEAAEDCFFANRSE